MLDIYNLVRAECGNLVVGNDDTKFGYVLSPDAPDVDLDLVYAALETLQKNGTIEFVKVAAGGTAEAAQEKVAAGPNRPNQTGGAVVLSGNEPRASLLLLTGPFEPGSFFLYAGTDAAT